MTVQVIEKDLLTVESGIIAHQVNCQGVMGSGVAKAIKYKWPVVFNKYEEWVDLHPRRDQLLGRYQIVEVDDQAIYPPGTLYVVNIFGQNRYGTDQRHTDYAAVAKAFQGLASEVKRQKDIADYHFGSNPTLFVPYNMGCDRGGGDWDAYSTILDLVWPGKIYACKLPS